MKLAGSMQDDEFPWGKADGAHSWHEGDDGMSIQPIVMRFSQK